MFNVPSCAFYRWQFCIRWVYKTTIQVNDVGKYSGDPKFNYNNTSTCRCNKSSWRNVLKFWWNLQLATQQMTTPAGDAPVSMKGCALRHHRTVTSAPATVYTVGRASTAQQVRNNTSCHRLWQEFPRGSGVGGGGKQFFQNFWSKLAIERSTQTI